MIDEKKLIAMGIAALLPGITAVRELLSQQENEYRDLLLKLQLNGDIPAEPRKRGRPSNASKALLQAQVLLPAPAEKKVTHGEALPDMIDGYYTRKGAAAYLGLVSLNALDSLRKRTGLACKVIKNPQPKGRGRANLTVFSKAALDAVKKRHQHGTKASLLAQTQKSYWYGMTKEQRAAEVRRRMQGRKAKAVAA